MTARRQILLDHGEETLLRVANRMGKELGHAMLDPIASDWYPETTFQRAIAATSVEACGGDSERFMSFIEACTEQGIHRFLRVILGFTSPGYLLSKMPFFWSRYRMNSGKLTVDVGEQSARLWYTEFPFFDDRNYWGLVRGVLRKTVQVSSGTRPDVVVRDYTRDSLVVDVHFAGPRSRPPPPPT